MDDSTAWRLNLLNREFYATVADDFDTTRGKPWPGWKRLLPLLPERSAPLSVLDVGCGNGRFGAFLAGRLSSPIHYDGIDTSGPLLTRMVEKLRTLPTLRVRFYPWDLLADPIVDGPYDLVALFGVLHHIPSANGRLDFMRRLASWVAPGGVLAFSCWRFFEYARFRDRVVPWPDDITVEPGDYLLDWRRGTNALRYCHYVDDAEHAVLVQATGLTTLTTYRADGHTGDANLYTILRRED